MHIFRLNLGSMAWTFMAKHVQRIGRFIIATYESTTTPLV